MQEKKFSFSNATVTYYFQGRMSFLQKLADRKKTVLITDENIFNAHAPKFRNWNVIVLKPGEQYKVQATADAVIEELIGLQADRSTTLVGIGGGVITDLTGYIASVFMRGIRFGFIPSTLLAMVDASIGGKNGIDVGLYKNMVGVIRQPSFILYDLSFLNSLSLYDWQNGFAEIIKHGCIRDAFLFRELEKNSLDTYRKNKNKAAFLIERNVLLKSSVVQKDEFEKNERKFLNFGHTLGHALENQYELSHGQAISIGMTFASFLSNQIAGFKDPGRVAFLLDKYGLPTHADYNKEKVISVLKMDKKKTQNAVHFILLEKIGKAFIKEISLQQLYQYL